MFLSGGDGDDRWVVPSYDDSVNDHGKDEYHAGGKGDDLIYGTHRLNKSAYMWGGEGSDKIVAGDDIGKDLAISGGHGDDKIYGGDYANDDVYLYGDWHDYDDKHFDNIKSHDLFREDDFLFEDQEDWINYYGDDVIMITDTWKDDAIVVGGYGNDTILGANDSRGDTLYVFGDNMKFHDEFQDEDYDQKAGGPRDGDDIIDIGDNNNLDGDGDPIYVYGQGGNDKIIGGIKQHDKLYGGDGDDKIWANNEGQYETWDESNWLEGGDGNDILYGSNKTDTLLGDADDDSRDSIDGFDIYGGDDIIYTGYGEHASDGDYVSGGWGNDKIYGEGYGDDMMAGDFGDDKIWGGKGDDYIWGDDHNPRSDGIYD